MKPCMIPDCPALAIEGSNCCAAHDAMTPREFEEEEQRARERFEVPQLRRVTDRIVYEKGKS